MRIQFDLPIDILHHLLDPVEIPAMARVRYDLPTPSPLPNAPEALRAQLRGPALRDSITPGARIAIGVGSRGIDQLDTLVRTLVEELRSLGAEPFVVPAMGSHGGATATGQADILEHLGVTEERVGAPIRADMTTETVGHLENGTPVQIDRLALQADGIVFVARVKPHTAFHATYESGLAKMIAIGLGKQEGAALTHARGFGEMGQMVPAMAAIALRQTNILFGVAVIENAHDQICRLEVVSAGRILADEPALLDEARAAMARIPYDQLDVLVIDEIGKNISGDGADPNITGRFPTQFASGKPDVTRQVLLDLTNASGGNANGVGTADFITARLAGKIDLGATYPNALTSTVPGPVKLPMMLPSDRLAIAAGILTCNVVGRPPRIMRLTNTLRLAEFQVSPALLDEVGADSRQHIVEKPVTLPFDEDGNLRDLAFQAESHPANDHR
jgi:hypothetical protein